MFRWVSIAPLETPVVPPVYWRNARSSPFNSAVPAAAPRPEASASFQRIAPSILKRGTIFLTCRTTRFTSADLGKPSMSPRPVTTTCFTLVSPMHSSSTCPKFSSTTIARAPESTELVAQLARGVQRIGVDDHEPRAQRADERDGILEGVGHHQGDAVAPGESRPAGEVPREVPGEPIELGEG